MPVVRDESAAPPTSWEPPALTGPATSPQPATIRAYTTLATAAFSRRDSRLPGYPAAAASARALGFAPVLRTVGGHLAPLHEETLIVDLISPSADPLARTRHRFRQASTAICGVLRRFGVPAQVGELPGEYCPGEFSVNASGSTKLAGIAQRVTSWGFLLSINLVVGNPDPLRAVVEACYRDLDLPVDPARVGAVGDHLPGIAAADLAQALIPALASALLSDDSGG